MKVLVIATNNVRRLLRERSNVFFVFIFPMLLILVIGASFGGGFDSRLGVVAPDSDELASQLIADVAASEVSVESIADGDTLADAVARGQFDAGLVVPDGYSEMLRGGQVVVLDFIARQEQLAAQQLREEISAAATSQSTSVRAARLLEGEGLASFAPALELAEAVEEAVPGVSVEVGTTGEALFENLGQFDLGAAQELTLFIFLTSLAGSAALIQSRQLGVSRRMLSTPTSSATVVTGETLGRFFVALVQGVFIMIGALLVFGVKWGDPFAAITVMVAFALAGAGGGMLLGSVMSNDQQAGSLGVFIGLGMAALGGAMVPIEIFPSTMQTVAKFTPHAWALEAFAELVRRDGSIGDILPQLGVLGAMAAGLLLIATWRFRKTLTA